MGDVLSGTFLPFFLLLLFFLLTFSLKSRMIDSQNHSILAKLAVFQENAQGFHT